MNAKIKRDWIKALRSGEYGQAEGFLTNADGDSMCCLGVLYDSCIDGDWLWSKHGGWCVPGEDPEYPSHGECTTKEMPSLSVLRKMGLSIEQADVLSGMNDSGRTFQEIADWIEANVEAD